MWWGFFFFRYKYTLTNCDVSLVLLRYGEAGRDVSPEIS